ncbi:hypothetical protein EXU57_02145 [Segetibacter sp. 3557_3]|uniref:hypothetical protein n=1 Tax=Segetibacter sp. 3557_3 TaxID=2547429 RepID=UPI001058CF5C|nr:hypothetical protein [Segetibacter sp. 3557_3]TDH28895.1 hypothetical protein EXU57_02145 [Segetibacter sp. 3557_3]
MSTSTIHKHLIYWVLPSAVNLACLLIYFFDLFELRSLIAPEVNREFGLVEHLQLVTIILIFSHSVKAARRKTHKVEKYGFLLIAVVAGFLLLEEIDYGLHYYDYLTGKTKKQLLHEIYIQKSFRNIHNQGNLTNVIKMSVYVTIVILFVLFPLLPNRIKKQSRLLNYLSPSRFIISTAVSLLVINQIALVLNKSYGSDTMPLAGNVSEFEEMMIYYILLMYITELSARRLPWQTNKKPQAKSPRYEEEIIA